MTPVMVRAFHICFAFFMLGVSNLLPAKAAGLEKGQPAGRIVRSPAPQLKWETWKEMLRETGKSGGQVYCKVKILVKQGQIQSVTMAQSSGFQSTDGEISEWIEKTWRFKPEQNGSFSLPIFLTLPKAQDPPDAVKSLAVYAPFPPFPPRVLIQLQKTADRDKREVTVPLEIAVRVTHGQILSCSPTKKTSTDFDDDVPYWIQEKWVFKKGVTGTLLVPLTFKVRPSTG